MDFKRALPPDQIIVSDGNGKTFHNYEIELNKTQRVGLSYEVVNSLYGGINR